MEPSSIYHSRSNSSGFEFIISEECDKVKYTAKTQSLSSLQCVSHFCDGEFKSVLSIVSKVPATSGKMKKEIKIKCSCQNGVTIRIWSCIGFNVFLFMFAMIHTGGGIYCCQKLLAAK